jgi:aspartate-semialdehyde dehydrogenase
MKHYRVAVLGATGAVGQTILAILQQRAFPISQLYPLASARSAGQIIDFRGEKLTVLDAAQFDFQRADIGLFSAGGETSAHYAPLATQAGCLVIDNTSKFRYDEDVPLVIPEVNAIRIRDARHRRIIANPNCSTMQMLVALKPIHDAVGIESIQVATYQAVSGTGTAAMSELREQTQAVLEKRAVVKRVYPEQIAFNVLPHIDVFQENGYTREEMKMVWETHKILEDERIFVNPTCVRVPVMNGHSEAIHLTLHEPLSVSQAQALLAQAPGVQMLSTTYGTPLTHGDGTDKVCVSRIRQFDNHKNMLNLWVVADNLRKGAALNAVQIAEHWIRDLQD